MSFIRDCWYCAGWSAGFGQALETRRMLGEDLVLFRGEDGRLRALEDTCPHRFLPLSMGRLVGNTVQCGYHGMTFDGSGACVRVPGQTNVPASARVRSYPVEERSGIVWVWMGDPARADTAKIFDLPEMHDPAWAMHHGDALDIRANYMAVAENLCDPAHVSFVHPTTLGNAASEDVPVETRREQGPTGEVIVTWRWIRDGEPIGFFKRFGGFTGHVDRWHYYYMHCPNIAAIDFGSAPTEAALPEGERNRGVRIWALHFLTPVDADRTVDYWMHIRNAATDVAGVEEQMDAMFRTAFDEDKEILEAVQARETALAARPGGAPRPLRIAIDLGPNLYRKAIDRLAAAEAAAGPG
ncbi:aromatic ring-hydroxylating dioxygenase subunit alpha [Paralimibaculum aggregatum]|uniref:Aromatic ring-hydroxylating dioxygenase subunit alpha n=1 Tax=Paralimibaculum aggregatum TaxID=3036245 RepID=A0ABQ6LM82_9RHOB|nr:aromatic ring-hydroxylating dioxygenase subunit alpha [Limibaculum sp. NKW23]GMG84319.1 aromatic ring-hydroxylating dioxygenase subunit alpha [Limibaculum sp. NKW23]